MQDAAAAAAADSARSHKTTRVLVVDDTEDMLLVMTNYLVPNGYIVEMARSGEECLQILSARIGTDDVPEVVLLDIMMGEGISGVECCREIRKYRGMGEHELPVILVTASSSESLLQKGFEAGATDYIQKPFSVRVLLARLENAIRLRELFTATVSRERDRLLLRRMLPESIIERLASGQNLIADHHESVTVLFSDIVGFTELSQKCSTAALMLMLNELFSAFDKALDRHGIYKVETIGDAYMCVAGHDGIGGHAERMAAFAREMLEACERIKPPFENEKNSLAPSETLVGSVSLESSGGGSGGGGGAPRERRKLQIRIGMHSGTVHAGVVGTRCPRYCFFGDTVNTASRMESNSFPMAIHVSNATATLLQAAGSVETIELGPRFIKGKGIMRTHVLRMGNYLGACRAFADLQSQGGGGSPRGAGANQAHEHESRSHMNHETHQSTMANLCDTETWVLHNMEGLDGAGVAGAAQTQMEHLDLAGTDPLVNKNLRVESHLGMPDRFFNSLDSALAREGHAEGPAAQRRSLALSSRSYPDVIECAFCCVANGMLSAADTAAAPSRARGHVKISRNSSPDAAEDDSLESADKESSALSYLARFMNMSGEDVQALSRNKMTLGTLERLTVGDLTALGVNNAMDAVSILRAAPALTTLRQFKAMAQSGIEDE